MKDVEVGPEIAEYIEQIESTMAPYGGRFLVHGGQLVGHEGTWDGDIVMPEFPDLTSAQEWYKSPDHQAILLGEAVERACRRVDPAFRRVNPEILGNTDPFLHAPVWPRFEWEPAELVGAPVWRYPRERWSDERFRLGPQHDVLREAIGSELDQLRSAA
ncbi:DUF1330 domain-containing protein [Streptomyces sp. NPDC048595]|uniref:DUF1330 domain-containing protein n=1 Tax=Streptomyces sp. NPDC048595 TaxID=3365576 RepID=UPI003712EAF7